MEVRSDMSTLSTVMQYLHEKGFDNEFTITGDGQVRLKDRLYEPGEVKLIRTFRFEGESDPSEQSILYLIEAGDGTIGYNVDAYGMYSDHLNDSYARFIHDLG